MDEGALEQANHTVPLFFEALINHSFPSLFLEEILTNRLQILLQKREGKRATFHYIYREL